MRDPEYLHFAAKILLGIELLPFQIAILKELWIRPFPMLIMTRGGGKSFLLAVYALLRGILEQGCKIVIVGAAFRQAKVIFEYMHAIYTNHLLLRNIIGDGVGKGPKTDVDRCTFYIGKSVAIAIPLGDGTKIRGLRANYILSDEFASIPPEIYETVIAGFASVAADPVKAHKEYVKIQFLKSVGQWTEEQEIQYKGRVGNQSVLSGTACYDFMHFATYWKRYKQIVETQGDVGQLEQILDGPVPENFNWRDYSIIRVPVDYLPPKFMDERNIARAKATMDHGIYQMEYGAVFVKDSHGFFKRSLIESCIASEKNKIVVAGNPVQYSCSLKGISNKKYIYGIDPASERDNLGLIVLEIHDNHRRIVYAWSINKKRHRDLVKLGLVGQHDYYGYCARKTRDLMKVFPCEGIAIDAMGGGIALEEALHDLDGMQKGEQQLWPRIDPDKEQDTDDYVGNHILEMCNFSKSDWVSEANHGLRMDMQNKTILFPDFDPITLELAAIDDNTVKREHDTLEDCVFEIEELKQELSIIIQTRTSITGREHWDTPEIKLGGGKKKNMLKDRYSALVMANMLARQMFLAIPDPEYRPVGGIVAGNKKPVGNLYASGPAWFTEAAYNKGFQSIDNVARK